MTNPADILSILDTCGEQYTFPMLDNGYVFLAAARLSAYSSPGDWALAIEVFGFSPRLGLPSLQVYTFGSQLRHHKHAEDFVNQAAYERYLHASTHHESQFFFPIADDGWIDQENNELVSETKTHITVRGGPVSLPTVAELEQTGIEAVEAPRIRVCEVCRYLAVTKPDAVFGPESERRTHVPEHLGELIVLNEWRHPDLCAGELPSAVEDFRQLAQVLATGKPEHYRPTQPANIHWSFWPGGGLL